MRPAWRLTELPPVTGLAVTGAGRELDVPRGAPQQTSPAWRLTELSPVTGLAVTGAVRDLDVLRGALAQPPAPVPARPRSRPAAP